MMKYILILALVLACSHSSRRHRNLVLIQGFHLDEHSWDKVIAFIPKKEFKILALDRYGRDAKKPSLNTIATHDCQLILDHSVLVAHSFGGAIANAMYGLCPEKISKIIYISAVIPMNGERPFARMKSKEAQKNYMKAVSFTEHMMVPHSPEVFYPAMDPKLTDLSSLPEIFPENMNLPNEIVNFDGEQFTSLPKSYIETGDDPVVDLIDQKAYTEAAKIKEVEGIDSGHFPMLSAPRTLAEMILNFARD